MLGISLTPSTLQRKQGALGIGTSRDPATVGQFDRTLEIRPPLSLTRLAAAPMSSTLK